MHVLRQKKPDKLRPTTGQVLEYIFATVAVDNFITFKKISKYAHGIDIFKLTTGFHIGYYLLSKKSGKLF